MEWKGGGVGAWSCFLCVILLSCSYLLCVSLSLCLSLCVSLSRARRLSLFPLALSLSRVHALSCFLSMVLVLSQHTATHCNTTHHTTLQHTTLQQPLTDHGQEAADTMKKTATQHTAPHCTILLCNSPRRQMAERMLTALLPPIFESVLNGPSLAYDTCPQIDPVLRAVLA